MRYANCFAADGTTPLTGDDLFAARATHRLFFEDGDRAAQWQQSLPELGWKEEDTTWSLDIQSLAWVLSLVTLDEDAEAEPFAFRQPTPAAWRRWLAALTKLAVPMHRRRLGTWLVSARSLLRAAPIDVREDLHLRKSDLEDGQGAAPPTVPAGVPSPAPVKVLTTFTWDDMAHRSARTLELASAMLYYGGSLRRSSDRESAGAAAATIVEVREALANRGHLSKALTEPAEDQAIAITDFLRVTAWPPELVVFDRSPARRKRCLKLRLAGAAGGSDPTRAYALSTRLLEALGHFPSVLRLLEGEGGKLELSEPELADLLGAAVLKLAAPGDRDVRNGPRAGGLRISDLKSLEDTLASHASQLAAPASRNMSPSERLVKLAARREQTSLAAGGRNFALDPDPSTGEDASKGKKKTGIPAWHAPNLSIALDSPNWVSVKTDLLAIDAGEGAESERDLEALRVAATGLPPRPLGERSAGAKAASISFATPPDRRTTLMLLCTQGVLVPAAVDADLAFLNKAVLEQWPLLVARQLIHAEWPRDRLIPPRLLDAKCPVLAGVLRSKDWSKLNVAASIFHLRRLRAGEDSTEGEHASTPPFGAYGQFQSMRPHLHAVLSLVGYPQNEHAEGWSAALIYADAIWRTGQGYHSATTQRTERAVDQLMSGVFADAAKQLATIRDERNPGAKLPPDAPGSGAWRAAEAQEDMLEDIPNVLGVFRYGGGTLPQLPGPSPHGARQPSAPLTPLVGLSLIHI